MSRGYWNLVDHLSEGLPRDPVTGEPRRAFYPPLAATPPGKRDADVGSAPPRVFATSDVHALPSDAPTFQVYIDAAADAPVGDLPNPAMRLHAMSHGRLMYRPLLDQLELRMDIVMPGAMPPWWRQWTAATVECIPELLIYDNVDPDQLRDWIMRLRSLGPGKNLYGLSVPTGVPLADDHATIIDGFLSGTHALEAQAGAVIGTAARSDAGLRELNLSARYLGGRAMNPRELFHLLFGNSSAEAATHPLFQAMQIDGIAMVENGDDVHPTRAQFLRPPLRTHARVAWEALREADAADAWGTSGDCSTRLYNTFAVDGRAFHRHAWNTCHEIPKTGKIGCYKCNLFVADFAVRSGFRVPIQRVGSVLHYIGANQFARFVHDPALTHDRVLLRGNTGGRVVPWGEKIDGLLRRNSGHVVDTVRQLTQVEGRCLALVSKAVSGSGHMALVNTLPWEAKWQSDPTNGFAQISMEPFEASTAPDRFNTEAKWYGAGASDRHHTYMHLFEFHPGWDPDTITGLANCNVFV